MTKNALLIGVSGYTDLPPLPAVINDVEAMRQVLENPDIGRFDNVEVCLDPSLVEIRLAIGRLFRSSKKGDLALLFFSGHGMTDNSSRLYLTTRITSKEEYQETSVPASFVHDMMNSSSCKRQVVILDCCYSGAFAKGWQPRGDINLQPQLGGEGRAILTSSSAIQLSFEEEGAGIYTRYLVEGIRTGAADLDQDGKISIEELHEYAQEQVKIVKSGMSPRMYADQNGRDIYLTQAPVNDPELEYRREVEKRVKQSKGELSWINQRTLKLLATQYNLTPETAERIIKEVLQPYDEHKELLKEYQEVFEQAIQEEYPLSDRIRRDLQDFQKTLGLTDEDVEPIKKQVLEKAKLPISTPEPESVQPTNDKDVEPIKKQVLEKAKLPISTPEPESV
ncbi:MAG: caspase family protein, partial [Cyanobacteria bacterium J06592_8]